MGYFGGVFALAGVTGPVLGGFFADHLSWRWIFWINLPIGLAAMVVVTANLRLPLPTAQRRVDYLGGALLVASVSCVMLLSVWGGDRYAWGSPEIAGIASAAVGLGILFVWRQRRAPEPMLPLRLLENRVVAVAAAIGFAISAAMFVATIFLPLFLQAVLGVSATNSGLAIAPTMAGVAISSIIAGRRMTATGKYKRYLVLGATITVVVIAALTQLDEETPAVARLGADIGPAIADNPRQIQALSEPLRSDVITVMASSISTVFAAALPLIVLAFVFALVMRELPLRETTRTAEPKPG